MVDFEVKFVDKLDLKGIKMLLKILSFLVFMQALAAYEQPNIVFIFADDHALQAIGAYGSKINQTPNIDRIANEGAIFYNSFCTNSICGPSRASVQTGKHSHKNGYMTNYGGEKFDVKQFTFPKTLQQNGYQTAIFGKWHLGSNPVGFDAWKILPGQGNYYNPDFLTAEGKIQTEGYVTTITTDMSLDWLEKRDKNKPFLLMTQHKAPHRTWSPDIKYLNKYDDIDIPEPETLFDEYENRSPTLGANRMTIKDHFYYAYDLKVHEEVPFATEREKKMKDNEYERMTPQQKEQWDAYFKPRNEKFLKDAPTGKELIRWKYQRYIKNYLRCIDSVDENVGRLLTYLEKNNLMENTIIVYSSDQGFFLGEHGWYDKRWMFEETFKMPFLIRWPKMIKAGSKYQQLIQNIDYAPTFLEAAGIKVPEEVQGKSLIPLFKNPEEKNWRDAVYYHYYETGGEHNVPRHEGVRDSRYKLINFYWNDGYNLYDLQEDPSEMKDVSKDPTYANVLSEMVEKLAKLRKEYDLPPLSPPKKQEK